MSFVLRKLDRKAAFYPLPTLKAGDVQADALSNSRTSGNTLSVWLVQEDQTNLNRIVAALAAKRDYLDKLDYALLDTQALDSLHIQVVKKKGDSYDDQANDLWHQDLTDLSGTKLINLASMIQAQAKAKLVRVPKGDVGDFIAASINEGFIDPDRVDDRIKKKLPPVT